MADQSHGQTETKSRPPFWLDRRNWSLLVIVALCITYLSDNKNFLTDAENTSFRASHYIGAHFTPESFLASFEERADACDYHWLFICEAPPVPDCKPGPIGALLCPPAKDDHAVLDPDRYRPGTDSGIIGRFWSGVLIIGAVPDMTWYVIKQDYQTGWFTFALLLVFLAINIAVATRAPLAALPIALPITVLISSGLFWLLGKFLALTASGVGVLFLILVAIAGFPSLIVAGMKAVVDAHDFQDFVHEVRTAFGLAKEIKRR